MNWFGGAKRRFRTKLDSQKFGSRLDPSQSQQLVLARLQSLTNPESGALFIYLTV